MHLRWQSFFLPSFIALLFLSACAKQAASPPPVSAPSATQTTGSTPVENEVYIDKGACPFECCTYKNNWLTTDNIVLLDKINGQQVVGKAAKGERVNALTGEVHTVPSVIEFTKDYKTTDGPLYKKDTKADVLTYIGEGFYKVRYQGKLYEDGEIYCAMNDSSEPCKPPIPAKLLKTGDSTWWVQIKLKDGVTGWTKVDGNFTNNDSCGNTTN